MSETYTSPGRDQRECKYEWFDKWDWLINRVLAITGSPVIKPAPGEIAIDTHIHSMFSHCSISRPDKIILRAVKLGLDAVAILDHNEVRGVKDAMRCAEYLKDNGVIPETFLIIPGTEINSKNGHIGALFMEEVLPIGLSPEETVHRIHEAGGLAVAVHPYHSSGIGDKLFDAPFDAVELECGAVFGVEAVSRIKALASDPRIEKLAKLGSSDAHYTGGIGSCYTTLNIKEPTLDAVKQAIAAGETAAHSTNACLKMRKWFRWIPKRG